MLEQGDVAHFHYLWHHEAQEGEESGRKPRPVCIVVKTPANPDVVFLFPFTTKSPLPGRGVERSGDRVPAHRHCATLLDHPR